LRFGVICAKGTTCTGDLCSHLLLLFNTSFPFLAVISFALIRRALNADNPQLQLATPLPTSSFVNVVEVAVSKARPQFA
jgi:hypothetical protein